MSTIAEQLLAICTTLKKLGPDYPRTTPTHQPTRQQQPTQRPQIPTTTQSPPTATKSSIKQCTKCRIHPKLGDTMQATEVHTQVD
eukprot:NODE_5716_length_557_cov_2.102362_g4978_i0.p1 GENE.NODE_5716_length_557_cov_2.102362_g4978_i0~~NODE_5716_length_557_cov_2.102362_g4978_i0.p1  ORF type:complete len:85 (+),score=6.11 NODE_5716_length_557_cov_2.102362_g4978_i0:67-321(+)